MMTQKAIIVSAENSAYGTTELNQLLDRGWRVVMTCPMPSASSCYPTCLVIVEKS